MTKFDFFNEFNYTSLSSIIDYRASLITLTHDFSPVGFRFYSKDVPLVPKGLTSLREHDFINVAEVELNTVYLVGDDDDRISLTREEFESIPEKAKNLLSYLDVQDRKRYIYQLNCEKIAAFLEWSEPLSNMVC